MRYSTDEDYIDAILWREENEVKYRVDIYHPDTDSTTLHGYYQGAYAHATIEWEALDMGYYWQSFAFDKSKYHVVVTVYTGRDMDGTAKIKSVYRFYNEEPNQINNNDK